ncbi:lytic transglycosylase domain-containing protein [Klenkia terrae]|uniref:Lytic transglycosylase domain-containing protein n=1 Tax=Klenkia terrae TaxID=1052259 RepID=A0ABU8EC97_9ACTN|nr:lytic transglycosylase domain-containing protein [Klenkia terrae]SSC25536.1 Lysozyme-like protein [Klenkia terrae]
MSARHSARPAGRDGQQPLLRVGTITAEFEVVRSAEETVAAVARGRHRLAPVRRPAVYLAAAAAGAVLVNVLVGGGPAAEADTTTEPAAQAVSVAQQLGITAPADSTEAATELSGHLQELAASRAQRETDEATAAQVQAAADQAAADAQAAAAAQAAAEAAAAAQAQAAADAEAAAENATTSDFHDYALAQLDGDASQFSCLQNLWGRESGWNPDAQNPTSTAYGIPQFLNSTWAGTGIAKTSNGFRQIDAGLIYLEERYGSPCGGWAQSEAVGWY